MAEIYQAQGRPSAAYNVLKSYLKLNPSARMDKELRDLLQKIATPTLSPVMDAELQTDPLDKQEFLKYYLRQTMLKMKEYEDDYSHLKMVWDERGLNLQSPDLFPITVTMDRNVLGVVFITVDDYIVLLEDVSIMYKDYLYYQNPYLVSGILLGLKGHYEEAAEQFRQAIKLDPGNAKAYNNLGITFFKMGKFEESRDYFLEALDLQPDNIFAHNNLGLTYLKLGNNDKAEEQFKRTLFKDPYDLSAHFFLGYLYYQKGEFSRAERYYSDANNIDSTLPQVNYALGRVMVGLGKWERAVDYFQKTLAMDETFLSAYVSLGGIYTRQEMFEEAEEMLKKAIDLEPDYAPAYYNLGCLYAIQEKKSEAIYNIRKSLEKGFADRELILKDKELESIRSDPAFQELLKG